MDLPLDTLQVWQIDGAVGPRDFLKGIAPLLSPGDVAMFGSYEPTEKLSDALESLGAIRHLHLDGYFMSFYANRSEHPNGCAFEYTIKNTPFEDILQFDEQTLSQKDISSFYDHFLAFRPGIPKVPLITFHDAVCGGTLYLSGHYSRSDAESVANRLSLKASLVDNPVLKFQE